MGTPDFASGHFGAIVTKAEAVRALIDAAAETDPGEDAEPWLDADEAVDELIALILDHPDTPRVMLALAAPAGAA